MMERIVAKLLQQSDKSGGDAAPPFKAHLRLFSRGGEFHNKNFYNHSTSIDCRMDRPNNGNILIAQELLDALQTKINLSLLTP